MHSGHVRPIRERVVHEGRALVFPKPPDPAWLYDPPDLGSREIVTLFVDDRKKIRAQD